jgi:ubiquinone/menaquinone biosynthesis C-methylase UbiE
VAYDKFWSSHSRQKLNQLEHAIIKELIPQKGHRIIDLGCGYGRLSDCYIDRFDMAVLFDGSLSLLKTAQEKTGGKATYIWGDINHLPFCESAFDTALMVRVVHHLSDANACMEQVYKILSANGDLILSYSNKRNILRVIRYFMGLESYSPFTLEPNTLEPNFIHYHPAYVAEHLSSAGFKVSNYRGAGMIDKLAIIPGPFWRMIPSGICLAPALGKGFLAPWIFCKGSVEGKKMIKRASRIEELLVCPACGSGLTSNSQNFHCLICHRKYAIIDGIIDMRVTDQD